MPPHCSTTMIRIEIRERIMTIALNRPEKKNALTEDMYRALTNGLADADRDKAVHVVLLHGTGDCFCSGNDLQDFLKPGPPREKGAAILFLEAISRLEKPIVAAVNGPAVGIGTTMLLHCDLVYAGMKARFHVPFVNLGLCPEGGSSYLLPRLMGYPRAAEMLLLGEAISARTAAEYGLINKIYRDEDLLEKVFGHARSLADQPLASVCLAKRLLKQSRRQSVQEAIALESRHFAERLDSEEFKSAGNAFLQHRKSGAPDGSTQK